MEKLLTISAQTVCRDMMETTVKGTEVKCEDFSSLCMGAEEITQ
jgi:hypothetical protein